MSPSQASLADYSRFAEAMADAVADKNTGIRFWCHLMVALSLTARLEGNFASQSDRAIQLCSEMFGALADVACNSREEREGGLYLFNLLNQIAFEAFSEVLTHEACDIAEIYTAARSSRLTQMFDDNEILLCVTATDVAFCRFVWGMSPRSAVVTA